ncbi:hypothetical protein CRUP_031807, partial [Coryphaenoides rupestris]
ILHQAWPFVGQYLEKVLLETVAPAIRASSVHLQTLSFTKVNLGDKALKVVGVKAHTEQDQRQVMLDLYLSYAGDVEINVEIKKYFCKAGVKGVQLHGKLRVILEPLIGDHPAPSTQHPAPCTQHPAPCTQHPAPCTQHPAPSTQHQHPAPSVQHPAPCTLHLVCSTQHPAPSTLHPAPSTLHPATLHLACSTLHLACSTQHPAPCT